MQPHGRIVQEAKSGDDKSTRGEQKDGRRRKASRVSSARATFADVVPLAALMSDHEHADDFTAVSYKKPGRAPRNRKGKNRFRERTLEEKLAAREEALVRSGYLRECRGQSARQCVSIPC